MNQSSERAEAEDILRGLERMKWTIAAARWRVFLLMDKASLEEADRLLEKVGELRRRALRVLEIAR